MAPGGTGERQPEPSGAVRPGGGRRPPCAWLPWQWVLRPAVGCPAVHQSRLTDEQRRHLALLPSRQTLCPPGHLPPVSQPPPVATGTGRRALARRRNGGEESTGEAGGRPAPEARGRHCPPVLGLRLPLIREQRLQTLEPWHPPGGAGLVQAGPFSTQVSWSAGLPCGQLVLTRRLLEFRAAAPGSDHRRGRLCTLGTGAGAAHHA